MASPTPSEYHDCPQNPLTIGQFPPPSPPLLALPLRGPIYEHLFPSTSDLGHSDSESAFAHDAAHHAEEHAVNELARSVSNASVSDRRPPDTPTAPSATSSAALAPTTDFISSTATPAPAPLQRQPSHRSQRPYWPPQQRSLSNASYRALLARQDLERERLSRPPIVLEDHSEAHRPEERTLWAKHVTVDDYVIVGNPHSLGAGAFVVWHCTLILDSGPMKLIKRYSEFDDLRRKLVKAFPTHEAAMPSLPPKSVMYKFRPEFLDKRKAGLSYFLNCVLLHPEFAASAVLQEWLFKRGKGVRDLTILD